MSEYVTYRISFVDDDGITHATTQKFQDSMSISAREWAEDYAYSYSGKREYTLDLASSND